MNELIRCLGGSVERIRRLRVKHGYNPEPGHMVDESISEEKFQFEDIAGYAYDFAAAQLTAADDHLLALETLLLEEKRKIPPFVLGRAAIEAAGRAAIFMDPEMSARDRAALVFSERRHEYQALRKLIAVNDPNEMPEAEADLAYVDLQMHLLKRFAKQHHVSIPSRPGFTHVLHTVLDVGEGESGFGVHATALLSAVAHAVPDTMVGVSHSYGEPKWRPGHVGFLDVNKVVLINLVRAVLLAYFRAVNRQILVYEWNKTEWQEWGEHVDAVLEKGREYTEFSMADERQARAPSGPWETILGPDPIESGPLTEQTMERWGVEAMEEAGIDPSLIHAFRKTGRIVAEMNMHLLTEEDIKEWRDAAEEYRTEHPEEYEEWLLDNYEAEDEDEDIEVGSADSEELSGRGVEREWMTVRVELVSGAGHKIDPRPGRLFLVAPEHTFGDLADAVELSFGRWEQGHLRVFELSDGRHLGPRDPEAPDQAIDEDELEVSALIRKGDHFAYVYDLGDEWRHECVAEEPPANVLPEEGEQLFLPRPAPISGWGWLPDQHGRRTPLPTD